jgi:putative ABC transport system permease protein
MIKNYLNVALRNLTRQKLFSLINISGLAIGLAVCMLIMLYVAHERSYDSFHKNADRIVTLRAKIVMNGDDRISENFSEATAPSLKDELPAVENYAASFKYFLPFVVNNPSTPQAKFNEDNLLYVDAGFFKFFSFKLISGQRGNVLSKPFSVVISRNMAKKYFGSSNPIGKTLTIKTDSAYNYQVTGIAENNPSNSSIEFNFVASASSLKQIKSPFPYLGGQPKLGGGVFNVFLLLKHVADTAKVLSSIQSMIKRHPLPGRGRPKIAFSLPLLTDIHLHTHTGDVSNVKYLKTFPVVAALILLLALFNYMSLSTARSSLRAKEVGVRKISGASRKTLAIQFYTESAVFTFLSFILGYLLCYLFKPWFLNVLQLKIDNSFLYSPGALMLLTALLMLTILVAGFYPALALSAFKPVVTLKGKMSKQAGGVTIRKIFTTLQFVISIALIICGIIIDRQLYFFRHTNSGMNRDNIVMLAIPGDFGKKYQSLKKEIGSLAGISEVATSNYTLFGMYDQSDYKGKSGDSSIRFFWQAVDRNFISMLGLKWKLAPALGTELFNPNTTKVIINETAVEKFNLGENPVGRFLPPANGNDKSKTQVAGVLKNFNFQSMQYAIEPFGLFVVPDSVTWSMPGCSLYAKIKPHTNLPSLIASMQTIYKKYDQNMPLSYSFVDEVFDAQYKAEDRLASIFSVFTGITILLAALGLFGLAAFTIEQRTKEIGIRKILGASLSAITTMLSKDFLRLVLLAIVIGSPIAWWDMEKWLQGFAFRITIQFWMFGIAGLLAVVVAVLTIGYHAFKAAIANPVVSLRSE